MGCIYSQQSGTVTLTSQTRFSQYHKTVTKCLPQNFVRKQETRMINANRLVLAGVTDGSVVTNNKGREPRRRGKCFLRPASTWSECLIRTLEPPVGPLALFCLGVCPRCGSDPDRVLCGLPLSAGRRSPEVHNYSLAVTGKDTR